MAKSTNPDSAVVEIINTHEFSNYTPQRDNNLSIAGLALSRMLTEALYNLDQLFLTPIRIVTWLAAAGIGITLLSPWGWFVVAPAIVLILFSALRAIYASPKAKDVLSLLKDSPYSNLELDVTLESKTLKIKLIQSTVVSETITLEKSNGEKEYLKKYFFNSLYEENKRIYSTKIEISAAEATEFYALNENLEQRKALYQRFLSRVRHEKNKAAKNTFLSWFFKAWTDFDAETKTEEWKALSFGEALLKRIKFYKENLAEPIFSFLFDAAFFYWIVWSGAYLFGAVNTTLFIALPFGTPLVLLGPLFAAVILFAVKNALAYRRRNEPTNSDATKHNVEALVKTTLAKQAAMLKTQNLSDQIEKIKANELATVGEFEDSERSLYQKMKDFFRGNFSIQAVTDVSKAGYRARIFSHGVIRFATGLILGFIAFWPVFDLVTTQWLGASVVALGAASSLVGPAMVTYLVIAVVIGLSFALYSFTKTPAKERFYNQEANRYAQLEKFRTEGTPENKLYKELRKLEHLIKLKKGEIAAKRRIIEKENFQNLRNKSFAAYLYYRYLEFPLGIMMHFANLVRRKKTSSVTEEFQECILAHDDKEFMEKFNLWRKSRTLKAWDNCKLFFNRFNEFVAAGGSGMLLVRIVFFAATACSVAFATSAFPITSLTAGLSLGIVGAIWAMFRLCLYLYRRDQNFADMLIHQTPAYKEVLDSSYKIACAELIQLNSPWGATLHGSVRPPLHIPALSATKAFASPAASRMARKERTEAPGAARKDESSASPEAPLASARQSAARTTPPPSVRSLFGALWTPWHKGPTADSSRTYEASPPVGQGENAEITKATAV